MPKLIEIIGTPGSGKTFICNELQKIKKDKKFFIFHSGGKKKLRKIKKLNFFSKITIALKVIKTIIIFYFFFFKRIFLKKIYKRNYFFRIIILMYRDLHHIETLKKILSDDKYLLMEPGIIMHFLQDYFYVNENILEREVKIFNRFFMNANVIIYTDTKINLIKKRLSSRKRGVPQRMRNLTSQNQTQIIKKSIDIIKNYISKSKNLSVNVIKIDTTKNIKKIKKSLLKSII